MMSPVRHAYLDEPGFVMAHRGFTPPGSPVHAENSLAAFRAALDLGVRHLETDVHATRDGRLVAFHDARLDRVTDGAGRIADLTWAQVRHARIGGVEPVPLLEDVLEAFPDARLNVDVKAPAAVAPLADLVRRTGCAHRLLVGSFSDRRRTAVLRALREAGVGPLAWSLGVRGTARVWGAVRLGLGTARVRAALDGACCLQVPEVAGPVRVVTRRLVDAVHAAGAQVHVWTVNDPADMARLLDLGVDALVTDRADLAVDLLRRRGPVPPP